MVGGSGAFQDGGREAGHALPEPRRAVRRVGQQPREPGQPRAHDPQVRGDPVALPQRAEAHAVLRDQGDAGMFLPETQRLLAWSKK